MQTYLSGTKTSELLVTGAVEGSSQGQELEGLVLLQLHAVEAVGILVADELGRVVTGAEAVQVKEIKSFRNGKKLTT